MAKLTLDEILAKQLQQKEKGKKQVEIYVPALDGYIVAEKQRVDKVLDMMDDAMQTDSTAAGYRSNIDLIYEHCAILHNPKLQEAYECAEPTDIVGKMFDDDIAAVNEAAEKIVALYGFDKLYDDVKN